MDPFLIAEQVLLQYLNDRNNTAINECLAIEGVNVWINYPVLRELLKNPLRQFQNVKSITCLAFASLVSDDATVRQLVEAGADIKVRDSGGYSPLHYACVSGIDSEAKVAYLMQREHHGALVNAADNDGRIPLHDAAEAGHVETVKLLLGHPECRVNAAAKDGRIPLHDAAKAGNVETVKLLLSHPECRVNAIGYWGSTPLRDAAEAGNVETVKLLLSHPEYQLNLFDDLSQTLDWARQSGLYDIAALVEDKSKGNLRQRL